MTHLVITNITRDQPARNGSPDLIYHAIFDQLDQSTTLVLNADDPGLMKARLTYKGKIITYGINKTKDSFERKINFSTDEAYCPNCHRKMHALKRKKDLNKLQSKILDYLLTDNDVEKIDLFKELFK